MKGDRTSFLGKSDRLFDLGFRPDNRTPFDRATSRHCGCGSRIALFISPPARSLRSVPRH